MAGVRFHVAKRADWGLIAEKHEQGVQWLGRDRGYHPSILCVLLSWFQFVVQREYVMTLIIATK